MNALWPFGPVIFSCRLVSGRSGTFANVTELVDRLTVPLIVSGNGAPHEIVIVGVVAEPPSLTVPLASTTLGSSGDVAVAVPIVQPVPVRHGMSAPALGVMLPPRWSTMLLFADSFAAWVIPSVSAAPPDLVAATAAVSCGAYGRPEQPVTLSGALAVFDVESVCESALIVTFAAGGSGSSSAAAGR